MFDIQEELKKLPQKPGVYIMKNSQDDIIYVGKAINLRNRVRQYFQNSKNHTPKVRQMVQHIVEFEYIITDSELEALILECNLIKKHRPKYNIALKDDRQYPYVKVTNETYPRIFLTRHLAKDKAKYYGPYTEVTAVKEVLEMIHEIWPIRKCQKIIKGTGNNDRPCLNYHIGQCKAPCNNLISTEEYRNYVNQAVDLLNGKCEEITEKFEKQMIEASENLEFEKAAEFRDKIQNIKKVAQKQKINNLSVDDQDVIAFAQAFGEALVQVFFIRNGKMSGREHFMLNDVDGMTRSEIMTEFIKQFYSGTPFIPKEIILQEEIDDLDIIQTWLSGIKGSKVYINVPQKGEKFKLVELAAKNAMITLEQFGEKIRKEKRQTIEALEEVAQVLEIDRTLKRVESYDISNIQGFESVGSMVVFENGKPKRNDYRKFKIKSVFGPNDYSSMEEVLTRRFTHALKEIEELKEKNIDISEGKFSLLPDLIMMDGGKGQLNVAKKVLSDLKLNILVCGLIKDDKHKTRGIIFNDKEITLPTNSEGFKLITRIQDEVHRFAIEYHRTLRAATQVHSVLDDIEGIGSVRRKALLRKFGSVEQIRDKTVEELLEAESMNIKSAEAVYNFFHKNKN